MDKTYRDRELLAQAKGKGPIATLGAFFRLSGPGWLQSAITLGGGSLGGALYLGMLGGTSMLWLQLVAIVIGVIMLSAISYVTLSTGERPYSAINRHVNPVLGVSWITATILANMIFILPQFSLCFDAIDSNLVSGGVGQYFGVGEEASAIEVEEANTRAKIALSALLGLAALTIVIMSYKPGWMSRTFDILLKLIVGVVVICFVAVVWKLSTDGALNWGEIWAGFIPNPSHWTNTAPAIQTLLESVPTERAEYWEGLITKSQQSSMIGVTATAVGLNMTFLLPYSMLARGWDKPFRGLARFDLTTGMAIPYIVVTSCIVIASAHAFHAKADEKFLSDNAASVQESQLFKSTLSALKGRYEEQYGKIGSEKLQKLDEGELETELAEFAAKLSQEERKLIPTVIKPNAKQLAASLAPLLGEKNANLVFGIGALAMGFSTIVILMLINGYAFAEIAGTYNSTWVRSLGAVAAGVMGFCWFLIWTGASRTWLIIVASTFAAILLPIAYISFFALMNSKTLLGDEKPTGGRMTVWNILMGIGVVGACVQTWKSASLMSDPETGSAVIGGLVTFVLLAVVGFSARERITNKTESSQ